MSNLPNSDDPGLNYPGLEFPQLAHPGLDAYRDLQGEMKLAASGRFIAESRIVVQRLLASKLNVESILCTTTAVSELADVHKTHPGLPIYCLQPEKLRDLVGFKVTRGMLAVARRPENPKLATLLAHRGGNTTERPIVVVCPRVTDPVNLAGIIRNSAAFGVDAIVLGSGSTDSYSRRVARVSMGTLFEMPIRVTNDVKSDLTELAAHGFSRCATVLEESAAPLMSVRPPDKLAIVFGSEGPGLDDGVLAHCDKRVTLPMSNATDSLNLSTASGIFLYHFRFA